MPSMRSEHADQFVDRPKLLTAQVDALKVAQKIKAHLTSDQAPALHAILTAQHPADLADTMLFLSEQEDLEVFKQLDTIEAAEAIIIRGLSTGHVQLAHWRHAVVRQLTTTMLLGGACSLILGVIGAIWAGN